MSGADDTIKAIIEGAARDHRESYERAVSSLSDADRRIIAAHQGFVLLHMRLCAIAEHMRRNKLPATIERDGGRIELLSQSRSAACICSLKNDVIQVQFLGGVTSGVILDFHTKWTPPAGEPDLSMLWSALDEVTVKIARHVAGS